MYKLSGVRILALSLGLAGIAAAPGATAADNVVIQWNNALLQAVRVTHPGPPIVARSLAVAHTCMYDAWAAYDPVARGTEFGKRLRRPSAEFTLENKNKAISFAAYRAAVDLFPSETASFNTLMSALGYDPTDTNTSAATPSGVGNVACAAVLNFRHGDGSNQLGDLAPGPYSDYTGYTPVNTPDLINDPNRWQPLRIGVNVQKYIAPFWGNVIPFSLKSVSQYSVKPPAQAGSTAYLEQAREVLSYSAALTDTQKVIAEYWADGPRSELPPGHWDLFAQFVSQRDGNSLDKDVKIFFALTNTELDASVWTWGIKRQYDYVRPVTAIHYLFAGQPVTAWAGANLGTGQIPGETWRPYQAATVVTPPFAEYVSGHSTFSAAGAEVLKLATGSDVFGAAVTLTAGSSRVESGLVPAANVTLSWATFSDAADEAGISRRYGGIHFRDGDLEGRRVGRLIGQGTWKKASKLFNGKDGDDD